MKNLVAFIAAFFAAKNTKFGCFGTVIIFLVVYWFVKKIL